MMEALSTITSVPSPVMPGANGNLSPQEQAKLKDTAQEFEAMFLADMLNRMSEGVEVNDMFGGGKGEEMFRSMLNQEYGKIASKSGSGIGLASSIQKAMIDMQAAADHTQ